MRRRMRSATAVLWRWYRSPTGLVFGALVLATAALLALDQLVPAAIVLLVLAGLLIPYKLRGLTDRTEGANQRAAAVERTAMADARQMLSAIESARTEWIDILTADRSAWRSGLDGQVDEIQGLRLELMNLAELGHRVDDLERSSERMRAALERDRQQRILANVRHRNDGRIPARALVLLTPQRSGSTWLFDMLRTSPWIDVKTSADLFVSLGAGGRRYPADLSNGADADMELEVQPGVGGTIPNLPKCAASALPTAAERFAIEKVHPSALGFDAGSFVRRLHERDEAVRGETQVVYLVRHPTDTLRSFIAYQGRSKRWHAHVPRDAAPLHVLRSLQVVAQLREEVPGPVIAYEDLNSEPIATLARLLELLGAPREQRAALECAAHAVATTMVDSRTSEQSRPFLETKPTVTRQQVLLGEPFSDPARALRELAEAESIYSDLVAASSVGDPPRSSAEH